MAGRKYYSAEEKENLLKLIQKYPATIRLSAAFGYIDGKKKAWERLTNEFNSNPLNQIRTVEQLRKLWDNLKVRRKAQLAAQKRDRMNTGNSLAIATTSGHHPENAIMNETTIEEMRFATDSDGFGDSETNDFSSLPESCKRQIKLTKRNKHDYSIPTESAEELDILSEVNMKTDTPRTKSIKEENQKTPYAKFDAEKLLNEETSKRIRRLDLQMERDKVLFDLQMEKEKVLFDLQIKRDKVLFDLNTKLINKKIEKANHEANIAALQLEKLTEDF